MPHTTHTQVLRGLTSYARNKKGPDDMRAVKSLNALAVMQARCRAAPARVHSVCVFVLCVHLRVGERAGWLM